MSKIITYRFSNEVELGKFLGGIDVIQEAYRAISATTLTYELYTTPSGIHVLAFNCSNDSTTSSLEDQFDLVSSKNAHVLNFICTKENSSISINKAAVELFNKLSDDQDLKELEKEHINTPLIITGSGLGGYLAILSTLRLHHAIDVEESTGSNKTKRPICITFGSPLVGDGSLQSAIAQRPQWKFSFLNVVAKKDRVASFLSSNASYAPLGTYLFCTESGGHAAFEDQVSILPILKVMESSNEGNLQIYDYNNVLSAIRRKKLHRGVSELGEFDLNSLREGIKVQLREVGVLNDISNDQIGKMEKNQMEMIKKKNLENAYDPTKKLNDMKKSLTHMERYMKIMKQEGGYYDSYKNTKGRGNRAEKQTAVFHRRSLNQYWTKFVEDKDKMPQKEGAKLRKRWLYSGTNYRRIVEPLDIAEYYKKGNTDYIKNRPRHYKLLEKWSDEDKNSQSIEVKRNKAASLTEDSCFWAHVEEALISLSNLQNEESSNIQKELDLNKLNHFESYVMHQITNYLVSPEIFLMGSTFMKCWEKYKTHKGIGYTSDFVRFMNDTKSIEAYK